MTAIDSSSGNAPGEFSDLQFVVISGPSGSGKTTIVDKLLRESPVKLVKSVSATTRSPRVGEVEGVDYYFLSSAEFQARRERNEFLECAEVHTSGNWYGTLKSEVQRARAMGGWSVLEIDVQGARQVIGQYPEALSIFVKLSPDDEYERRLRGRRTDSEEVIQLRLENARNELQYANSYRYQVVNADLERAVQEVIEILSSWEAKRSCSKS